MAGMFIHGSSSTLLTTDKKISEAINAFMLQVAKQDKMSHQNKGEPLKQYLVTTCSLVFIRICD
ncbi:TPA: hypothetical protein ACSP2T_004045, partial [Aeromonas hydrophila]